MRAFGRLILSLLAVAVAPAPTADAGDLCLQGSALPEVVLDLWTGLANTTVSRADSARIRASDPSATTFNFDKGWGDLRTDFYGVEVQIAAGTNPQSVLNVIRDNVNKLGGRLNAGHVDWPVAPKGGRAAGAVVDLDILGPDNGAIAYLDADTRDGEITVITVQNNASGTHPVSGLRRWGYEKLDSGNYLFYTVGIESANVWGSGGPGAVLQDNLWSDLVRDIGVEVEKRGGKSLRLFADDEWQPNDLKPGRVTRDKLDHPGAIDWQTTVKWERALNRAKIRAMSSGPGPL